MPWNVVTGPCVDCGREVTKYAPSKVDLHCIDCGKGRAARAADEMYNKSGPAWDKFCASLARRKSRHNTQKGT